jgi:hypothetical protein
MPETIWSIWAASMGRLRQAMATARASLSRSKISRCQPLFNTVNSRSCTRSQVVKRAPHPSHCRRRRIAALSSVGRESFTWLSSWAQKGQRTRYFLVWRQAA